MHLDELSATWRNGLHDAQVNRLSIDYVQREVVLELNVWVGDLASDLLSVREAYRMGTLVLSGLLFCCIDPPDARYPYQQGKAVTIDTGTVKTLNSPPHASLPTELPTGAFTQWFFVQEWNAFIYVAATHAQIRWRDEAKSYDGAGIDLAESAV